MKKTRILLQITTGFVIIAFILNKLDINEVITVIRKTNLFYFTLACLSYLCLNFILAYRLNYLLAKIGYNLKFPTVFKSHMGGMMVGDITPGRGGYFLTPPILKKSTGTRITDGMACIFAPQGIEFILKVAGAIAALLYISINADINGKILASVGLGAGFLLIVGILMLIISWHDEKLTSKFLNKLPFFNRFTEKLSSFKEQSIEVKNSITAIIILSLTGWVFAALHWFYLGKSLGIIELPYFVFFLLHPLITILMFVPVSPAGFGLMEGGVILVFALFGIPPTTGLAFSVLVRVSILLVDLIGLKTVLSSVKDLSE